MHKRVIDFQGLIDLDPKVVAELSSYLQEKETRLAYQIINAINPMQVEAFNPILPMSNIHIKLSEAVDGFSKKVRSFVSGTFNQMPNDNGSRVLSEINKALWDYTEVLESGVIELFQQVKQVNVDRWHISINDVVLSLKDLLLHHVEDLKWAVMRLEQPLKDFVLKNENKSGFKSFLSGFHKYIDSGILKNLDQSDTYLKKNYDAFQKQYQEFEKVNFSIEEPMRKLNGFPVYSVLDSPVQSIYGNVFKLLKMLEQNKKGDLAVETVRSLKNMASVDSVSRILELYFEELADRYFKSSLDLKAFDKEPELFKEQVEKLKVKLREYSEELKVLIMTIGQYRSFILKAHPNPYVSSRWGFTEWIVGPEPEKAKQLLHLIYKGNDLLKDYQNFMSALDRTFQEQQKREIEAHHEIESLLHEMGQPLISRTMMHSRAEKLLEQINACDEVGTSSRGTVIYIGEILAKAMREDWKYHVMHEFTLFHEIVRKHLGLSRISVEPPHVMRKRRFQQLFDQIGKWIQKGDFYSHVHEIELDINDMKTYLQDFLAMVQRAEKEKSSNPFLDETIKKFRLQLFEYRYQFGYFFYLLMSKNSDCQQLRNQFLFVDQYFETIENLLNQSQGW